VELRVTAKSGFEGSVEHGVTLARSVEVKKSAEANAISKVHHGDSGLLLE